VPTRELTVGPLTGYHLKLSGLSSEAVEQLGDSITSLIGQDGLSLEFGRQADTLQGEESPASGGLSVSSSIVRLDEVTSQTNPLTTPSGAGMLQIKTTDPVGNYTTTSRFFPDPIRFSLFPHMTLTIKPSLLTGKQAFDRGVIGVATGHPKS
ncbi:MAG TPA: hypothetical protein VFQ63_02190, partial [Patescibacteria group bacterium]|nr:hypothetical protein [Patescibacteria group bacterium]